MGKKSKARSERTESPALSDEEAASVPVQKTKKGKKKIDEDSDEIARELEEMKLEHEGKKAAVNGSNNATKKASKAKKSDGSDDEESEEEETIQVKSKFGGFTALIDDDMCMDVDDDGEEEENVPSESDDEPAPPPPPKPSNKDKKKNNTKQKKVVDDWDDLDDLIEPPAQEDTKKKNKKDKKKAKKNKQQEDDEEDFDKLLQEVREMDGVSDVTEATPEQPVVKEEEKPIEDAPASNEEKVATDDSKLKKKDKKRKKKAAETAVDEDNIAVEETEKTEEVKVVENEEAEAPGSVTPPQQTEEQTAKKGKRKKKDKETIEQERLRKKEEEERKKEEEEDKKRAKKGLPNKKVLAAMRELQQKQKEEEEARKKAEEELQRQEEERVRQEEEKKKLEEERKERKKQKEKERKERLKAEGKLLTAKQKADQRRAQEMLEHLKAQGVAIPESGEKKAAPRLGSKAYIKKKQQAKQQEERSKAPSEESEVKSVQDEAKDNLKEGKVLEEGVKDSWDLSSDEEENTKDDNEEGTAQTTSSSSGAPQKTDQQDRTSDEEEDMKSSEDEEDNAQSVRERVMARIKKRKELNESNRNIDVLRAPVVCVLGHVDHGKTKILDKLRRTNVQEGEVGGITQQIGATNVPADAITQQTKMVKSFSVDTIKFPGLLIIDTPGHESFSNLRNRGSSLCDIAILVVDITQGLEPQTLESIELLKKKKVPFVIALNKVDRIFEWESNQHKDIRDVIKNQKDTAKNDFERRSQEIILKLTEQGLNVAMFWENDDTKRIFSLIPTSAITGDGMGNLIALICDLCQTRLAPQLRYTEELQCIVLEVKTIQGHGTTVDVILINGRLREGDTMILAGTDGAIVTQIRSLLLPKPMKEIRVKGAYDEFKEVKAAQGIKIAAKDLDKAIAGLSLRVANNEDEIEFLKTDVEREFSQTMRSIKVSDKGVYVQASTLGALEALLEFFKTKKIPYSGIRVGPVVKKDVMKAAAMLEHDDKYAVILAFDVKVERDAQELADKEHVRIFSEETIYHLGDRYVEFLEEHKRKKQDEHRAVAVFPCKLSIIPTAIFNKRDPIVLGVKVEHGILRTGTLLCVPSKEFVEIGVVTSMEFDHKPVDIAKKGVDVCIKIDPSQGSTPKLYGRHFEAPDEIVSKISRESINACKDFFRDDLSKADWKLMSDLKKLFNIL